MNLLFSSVFYVRKSIGIKKIFDFCFLMDLHVFLCPERNFFFFSKYMSVCDTYFVAALEQTLMDRIA